MALLVSWTNLSHKGKQEPLDSNFYECPGIENTPGMKKKAVSASQGIYLCSL